MKNSAQLHNEPQLILRLQQSDVKAFEAIFHYYYAPLKSFALQELKSNALAEDAVQDILCALWLKRKTLQSHLSLRGYLFTCLKNYILNLIRTKSREIIKHQRHFLQQQAPINATEFAVISKEIEQDIHLLIEKLPEIKRQILQMSIYQGLSNQQIAEKLNLSIHTVKVYLSESSRSLRKLLSSQSGYVFLLLLLC